MNLYKVLLVDDEEEVFQMMIKKLNWEENGFEVIGYANNGEDALEMAEKQLPDVVLTDIKMPFMDGLTLSRHLKELYGNIKVIIYSGFDDFEYAREAIKLEVEEYILKPIKSAELQAVFTRVRENLDRELEEKRNVEKLKEYYIKSLPVIQEEFLISLLEGRVTEDRISILMKDYQVIIHGDTFATAIVHIDTKGLQEMAASQFFGEEKLLSLSIQKMVDEQLGKEWSGSKILSYSNDIVIVATLDENNTISRFVTYMNKLCRLVEKFFHVKITIGIGMSCNELSHLNYSYQSARSAIDYRFMKDSEPVIYIGNMEPEKKVNFELLNTDIQGILREIKLGDKKGLQEAIEKLVNAIEDEKLSSRNLRIVIMDLVTELIKLGSVFQLSMDEVIGGEEDIYKKVSKIDSADILTKWLDEICTGIRRNIRQERVDSAKLLVNKAKQYVEENYSEVFVSIESVCSYLSVSCAYFSTVFKKETEKTFINYLTDYRLEKAIFLLETTEEKTYIISEKVGYIEPNYFSYVFKKHFGIPPSKYRSSREKNI